MWPNPHGICPFGGDRSDGALPGGWVNLSQILAVYFHIF